MQFNLKATLSSGIRNAKDSNINKVNLTDLINEIKADSLPVRELKNGAKILHVHNSKTGDYFPINFGPSVGQPANEDELRDILNEAVIFTGTTDRNGTLREKPWFSFGLEGSFKDSELIVSVADYLAGAKKAAASMAG